MFGPAVRNLPRPSGRGPIDAEQRIISLPASMAFRGHPAAAPLTRKAYPADALEDAAFRGHPAAAPLTP